MFNTYDKTVYTLNFEHLTLNLNFHAMVTGVLFLFFFKQNNLNASTHF